MKTSVNIKMEEKDKKEAKELFENLGLDMSTAINLFIKAALRERGIPFPISEEKKEITDYIQSIQKDIELSENEIENDNIISHEEITERIEKKYGFNQI